MLMNQFDEKEAELYLDGLKALHVAKRKFSKSATRCEMRLAAGDVEWKVQMQEAVARIDEMILGLDIMIANCKADELPPD